MKIRVIKQGDREFTYDGEDEASIRQALLHDATGIPGGDVYDITDLDRSDMDADEYLIATEDDGTPVWSGWLGGVTGPPPAITVTPAGHQGPAAHTWTAGCAGHHPPMEPCPAAAPPAALGALNRLADPAWMTTTRQGNPRAELMARIRYAGEQRDLASAEMRITTQPAPAGTAMEREKARYEQFLSERMGTKVTLA